MNALSVAIKGKGAWHALHRGGILVARYGLTARKMERALNRFVAILRAYQCQATFPTTAVALRRSPRAVQALAKQGIEFAIHGYRHVDHTGLSWEEQVTALDAAVGIFERAGIHAQGFRCPYLRHNADTLQALRQRGLTYDSSQGLAWDVLGGKEAPAYRHVLDFYGAKPAAMCPVLPSLEQGLVRIPYSLPDDEALVERLGLATPQQMIDLWLAILDQSYRAGELFTIGLHPERIANCVAPLQAVLQRARQLEPEVWIARLDEIAAWWRARYEAQFQVTQVNEDALRVTVSGPPGTVLLARDVEEMEAPTVPWEDGYRRIDGLSVVLHTSVRPWIGVSPDASPELSHFLRQQGYLIECRREDQIYGCCIDQRTLEERGQRSLLTQIEGQRRPLLRLGRWPDGTRSALAVTGDVDALTLWDYVFRLWES